MCPSLRDRGEGWRISSSQERGEKRVFPSRQKEGKGGGFPPHEKKEELSKRKERGGTELLCASGEGKGLPHGKGGRKRFFLCDSEGGRGAGFEDTWKKEIFGGGTGIPRLGAGEGKPHISLKKGREHLPLPKVPNFWLWGGPKPRFGGRSYFYQGKKGTFFLYGVGENRDPTNNLAKRGGGKNHFFNC